MKKYLRLSIINLVLAALFLGGPLSSIASARPPILLGPLAETVSNQPILMFQDFDAYQVMVEVASSRDIHPTGGWFTDPNKIKKYIVSSQVQAWDFVADGIVLSPGTYWWQAQGYYSYPAGVAWSIISYFIVPASSTPTPTPTPTIASTPAPAKKRVATNYHKYTCKYVKGWHKKHCKSSKNKKQSKKNKAFHKKKCTKLI